MNLEALLLGDIPVPRLIERARLAEASGYSAIWLAEERFVSGEYRTPALLTPIRLPFVGRKA